MTHSASVLWFIILFIKITPPGLFIDPQEDTANRRTPSRAQVWFRAPEIVMWGVLIGFLLGYVTDLIVTYAGA